MISTGIGYERLSNFIHVSFLYRSFTDCSPWYRQANLETIPIWRMHYMAYPIHIILLVLRSEYSKRTRGPIQYKDDI